jgi:hypothetical protein
MRPLLLAAFIGVAAGCAGRALEVDEHGQSDPGGSMDAGVHSIIAPDDLAKPPDLAISCVQAQADFQIEVYPLLLKDCGTCHSSAGGGLAPDFLMGPDPLASLLSHPGLVGATPDSSALLHPPATTVTDPSYTSIVSAWIIEFNGACRPR